MTLFGGLVRYSFDSGAFINGRRSVLPADVFPSVWEGIAALISDGSIRAIDVVAEEIARRDDDACQWVASQPQLVTPLTDDIMEATSRVLRDHPKLVAVGGKRSAADPFVIGLAIARSAAVVTEETASGKIDKPRIPDVCDALEVPCMTLVEFVRNEGWRF